MLSNHQLICVGCNKHPDELDEYIEAAADEPEFYTDAADYVRREEGTLNFDNGHFLCSMCYIEAGCPTAPRGWICP